jgi:beta-galactosidase
MGKKIGSPIWLLVVFFSLQTACSKPAQTSENKRTGSFDMDWRFIKDNPAGAEDPGFDDSGWRTVDLPHDWSIEDLPDQIADSIVGPFSRASIGKMGTGFTVGGTAWYRKTFIIDRSDREKMAYLQFDGIYMNSDVWVNGKHAGNHPHGYTSFWYDITPYLNPAGQANVVAVQVKNEGRNARWYSGSGIYRHTWLTLVDPVHIGMWGVYVTTPVVSETSADIAITTTLNNKDDGDATVTLLAQILDPSGNIVGSTESNVDLPEESSSDITQEISIEDPSLWSTQNPNLYRARISVLIDEKEVDRLETAFGIRSIHFDAKTGFSLNGQIMELKGGCFHHDNGPLGAASIDRAEERKIELLKSAGFNAIRCSHNPPSPYLLEVCDRLGILVINELYDMWEMPKIGSIEAFLNPQANSKVVAEDYSRYFKEWWQRDVRDMVVRDRNHPSIIMWSIGNETIEALDTSGFRIARNLAGEVRRYDHTRAVTEAFTDFAALMGGKSRWDESAPHMDLLDAVGYNYLYNRYEEDHEKHPDRLMYASEFMPPNSLENWQMVENHPYVIGNFAWVAMDYLGEAGIGLPRLISDEQFSNMESGALMIWMFFNPESWPVYNAFCGNLDLIGNPKVPHYYQQVVWRNSQVELFVHQPVPAGVKELSSPWGYPDELKSWSWEGHEGENMLVHVYTRSKLVRLELNGKLVGEQTVDDNTSIIATFEVPYEAGTLTARCFDDGEETASESIQTVGSPVSIRLVADRATIKANRNDLSYVMVEITDAEGNIIPDANDVLVNFEISGSGEIAGLGSGDPSDISSFQEPRKKTWHGRCLVIIRPDANPGRIALKASSEGLGESTLEIIAE